MLRFQRARGLAVDGVVGPQTKAELIGRRPKPQPRRTEQPAPRPPAEAPEPPAQAGPPADPTPPADPARSPEPGPSLDSGRLRPPEPSGEVAPGVAALLGALAAALMVGALWASTLWAPIGRRARRRGASPGDVVVVVRSHGLGAGLACALLLGTLALGAAGGALFASRASPDAAERRAGDERATEAGARIGPLPVAAEEPTAGRGDGPPPTGGTGRDGVARPATVGARRGAVLLAGEGIRVP